MAKEKRVGVILAGSGYLDGSEIQEATLTLLFLDKRGARVTAMAPNVRQMHVVDHVKGDAAGAESRNVLAEAARITRGAIVDVRTVKADDLDALIIPGGYGAAKNLCTFATEGVKLQVNPDVERLVRDMATAGKPLGFVCIAPVIAAKVLSSQSMSRLESLPVLEGVETMSEHEHGSATQHAHCCPCTPRRVAEQGVSRRAFLAGTALDGVSLTGLSWTLLSADEGGLESPPPRTPLKVKPILVYSIPQRRPQSSWRNWGGIQTQAQADEEVLRIKGELEQLKATADFPVEFLPIAAVQGARELADMQDVAAADTLLVFAAGGGTGDFNAIGNLKKDTILFVRFLHMAGWRPPFSGMSAWHV